MLTYRLASKGPITTTAVCFKPQLNGGPTSAIHSGLYSGIINRLCRGIHSGLRCHVPSRAQDLVDSGPASNTTAPVASVDSMKNHSLNHATLASVSTSETSTLAAVSELQQKTSSTSKKMSGPGGSGKDNDPNDFIRFFSNSELLSFLLVSCITSSPALLKLAIKTLPYTPGFLVKAMIGPIYLGGETFKDVKATGMKLYQRGVNNMMLSYSVEDAEGADVDPMLLESVVPITCEQIDQVLVQHHDSCEKQFDLLNQDQALSSSSVFPGRPCQGYIAIKPTGLMKGSPKVLQHYDSPDYQDKWQEYLQVCRTICQYAKDHGQNKVRVVFDAEKRFLQDGVYAAQRQMMKEFNRDGQTLVISTIQMYLQDSLSQLRSEMELARAQGYNLGLKLVRGAYLHSEPDRWHVIHKTKEATDVSYNTGLNMVLDDMFAPTEKSQSIVGELVIASHNRETTMMAHDRLSQYGSSNNTDTTNKVVFGQLMGMCDDQTHELACLGRNVIKYVPWGPIRETKDYLLRRLEENSDAVRQGGWPYIKLAFQEFSRRLRA